MLHSRVRRYPGQVVRGGDTVLHASACHQLCRNSISSSRVNPASLNRDFKVPFGMSRLCCGTTASFRAWMVVDQMTARNMIEYEPIPFEKSNDLARPNGGKFRQTRRRARQPASRRPMEWAPCVSSGFRYSLRCVLGHFPGCGQGPTMRHATRQRGHNRRESAFRFRPKHNVEMSA
jgi:hypothetical protein